MHKPPVVVNGKMREEVECFKYLGSHVAVDGEIDVVEVKFRMNEPEKVCERMKSVFRYTCSQIA